MIHKRCSEPPSTVSTNSHRRATCLTRANLSYPQNLTWTVFPCFPEKTPNQNTNCNKKKQNLPDNANCIHLFLFISNSSSASTILSFFCSCPSPSVSERSPVTLPACKKPQIKLSFAHSHHYTPTMMIPLLSKTASILCLVPGNFTSDKNTSMQQISSPDVMRTGFSEDIDDSGVALLRLRQPQRFRPQVEQIIDHELEQEIQQASQLLLMSLRGAHDDEFGGDEKLQRVLTVHSLARIINSALPSNLTEAEVCEIRSSLPPEVLNCHPTKPSEPYIPQNKLEEVVVTVVRAFFIGLKTAAPFVKQILLALAREERKYKISERFVATGISALETVCRSRVGRTLVSKSQGIAGSVLRGVSQGMSVIMVDIQDPAHSAQH